MSGGGSDGAEDALRPPDGAERPVSFAIERLTFDGFAMSGGEARRAGAAMERELARLAASVRWDGADGGAARSAQARPVSVAAGTPPEQLGRAVARAVFGTVKAAP